MTYRMEGNLVRPVVPAGAKPRRQEMVPCDSSSDAFGSSSSAPLVRSVVVRHDEIFNCIPAVEIGDSRETTSVLDLIARGIGFCFGRQQRRMRKSPSNGTPREYYELRQYHMQNGPQTRLTDAYISDALIPALNRLGISPVGAFNLTLGPETPTLYVLLPSIRLETLVTAQLQLAQDATFMQAAAPFWNAPANQPAYVRVESSLMIAFEGRPRLRFLQ